MQAPPRDLAELMLRARALEGHTLGELADALGTSLPDRSIHAKGRIGQVIERCLGASAGSAPIPDFAELGVELKTIPIDAHGRPRESTFVCTISPLEIAYEDWSTSRCRSKLAHVLWVPVDGAPVAPADRRVHAPLLWRPSEAEEQSLRQDWEDLVGVIGTGGMDALTGHRGRYLQVRPKGASAQDRTLAPGPDDTTEEVLPRGFYLRSEFTGEILRANKEQETKNKKQKTHGDR